MHAPFSSWLELGPLLLALTTLAPESAGQASVWHVRAGAPPGGDGGSWAAAFASLEEGLTAAAAGDQVWVAAGTYLPSRLGGATDPREARFELRDQVSVYGGFQGDETSLAERAGLFDETVLSGDIGVPSDPSDNAYSVVRFASDGNYHASARLDGFRITQGRGGLERRGGGLRVTAVWGANSWCFLEVANCTITDNASGRGGGIGIDNFCKLNLLRSTVSDNLASVHGGGVYSLAGQVWGYNCVFRNNLALQDGGALFANSNASGWMRFANSLFHDNLARRGGAAYLGSGTFVKGYGTFRNCTLAYNSAALGGGIFASGNSRLKVFNSILWGNRAARFAQVFPAVPSNDQEIHYSDIQGGFPGVNNLQVAPHFADAPARDLRTLAGSATHDRALGGHLAQDLLDLDGDGDKTEAIPFDLDDRRRLGDDPLVHDIAGGGWPAPDMGAYEHHP